MKNKLGSKKNLAFEKEMKIDWKLKHYRDLNIKKRMITFAA
ncbi:MAG: hypothetical protein ACI93S_001225 [Ancylomarina sp.]|jgi:hypothetical protein